MAKPNLVTLRDVAARANTDADFFAEVVRESKDPNRALAKYDMVLSSEDSDRLRAGIAAIEQVDLEFQALAGGWGRWPRFNF